MKYLIPILPLIIFYFSCEDEFIVPAEYGQGNDYRIYELILNDRFPQNENLLILRDSTRGEVIDSFHISAMKEKLSGLLGETLSDYIQKNKNETKLKNIPNVESITFESSIINKPDNAIYIWLSNIGYNNSETQAILTLGERFGPEAGGGILYFLIKTENDWEIKYSYALWIS